MILNWLNNENAVKANLLIELGFDRTRFFL
jgi:hypothetical protein